MFNGLAASLHQNCKTEDIFAACDCVQNLKSKRYSYIYSDLNLLLWLRLHLQELNLKELFQEISSSIDLLIRFRVANSGNN